MNRAQTPSEVTGMTAASIVPESKTAKTTTKRTIPETAPWMIPFFPGGYAEAANYTKCSSVEIIFVCPDCGKPADRPRKIVELYKSSFIGCICNDSVSIPEKFMYNLLRPFISDHYQRQLSRRHFPWAKGYRYDAAILAESGQNNDFENTILIEIHGKQHYEELPGSRFSFSMSLKDIKQNDSRKKALAIANGILPENFYELDCRITHLDYMKNSVMTSGLLQRLGIDESLIAWDEIYLQSIKSINNRIVNHLKQNPSETIMSIAARFDVSRDMVYRLDKEFVNHDNQIKKNRRDMAKLNERHNRILTLLLENPDLTGPHIARKLNIDRSTVLHVMQQSGDSIDLDKYKKLNKEMQRSASQAASERKTRRNIEKIKAYCESNPDFTSKTIAKHLGLSYGRTLVIIQTHEVGIDMARLLENEAKAKHKNCKARNVKVIDRKGTEHVFNSIDTARKQLSIMFKRSFPDSSVRRCIKQNRDYEGFSFIPLKDN